ncbi:MAG: hypothetical protein APF77_11040 [Clostridia bacterium BRH_c25]|nr:MAG: hypothetical protein APF77_11040 [Clostridia bacterium BRH_c25]
MILGGAGFIGSNLAKALTLLNAEVVIINKNIGEKKHALVDYMGQQNFVLSEGNLLEPESYEDFLRKADIVINLAGANGSLNSIKNPVENLRINCEGHLLFLESCRRMDKKVKLIFASSRLVYGETGRYGVTEDIKTEPKDIYAIHKLTAEYYYSLYANMYPKIESMIVRMTNPFGPAPRYSNKKSGYNFINSTILKVLMSEEITVYGDGKQLRDYIYIDDLVEAVLGLANVEASKGEIFNIGSGNSICIMDAILQMFITSGKEYKVRKIEWPSDNLLVETGDFKADITKIERICNWKPRFRYQEGLRKTIEFLKNQYNLP